MTGSVGRWAWAEVHHDAIAHNVAVMMAAAAPAAVWAVVKADAYGHGSVPVARTVLAAGASGLCVALVQEGVALRHAGIDAPILVLSEQPVAQLAEAVGHRLTLTVYSHAQLDALEAIGAVRHPVHLKVDTGMHRVGCTPADARALARCIVDSPAASLHGVFTHLAMADEPDDPANARQLAMFDEVLAGFGVDGIEPGLVHAGNSASALALPAARRHLVRPGIALYGISPGRGVDHLATALRPAMSLHARVSHVQRLAAGERISYGLRHTLAHDATVATVPVGYADGVPRRLFAVGGQVLVGGIARRMVGVVTMDQLMIDMGDDAVAVGDPVVLLGTQGDRSISAVDWAERLDTIGYEIVCGMSARIARQHLGRGPAELAAS